MKKSVYLFAFAILTISISVFADPALQSFQYWVRVPQTQNTCQQEAISLGQRFVAATGMPITSAECRGIVSFEADGKNQNLYSLLINFQSEEQPQFYSAILGSTPLNVYPGTTVGAYSGYSDCLSDIGSQVSTFSLETSLAPISATCQPGDVDQDLGANYFLKIDGFGNPKMQLFVFQLDGQATNRPSLIQVAATMLSSSGAANVKVIDSEIFYYAAAPIMVEHDSVGDFDSLESCTTQLPRAQQIFTNAGNSSINLQCQRTDLPFATLEVIHLGGGMAVSDYGLHSAHYFTMQECLDDRDRLLGPLQSTKPGFSDPRFLGGLCLNDPTESGYKLSLFTM